MLIGAVPEQAAALVALATIGVSNAFVDVALFTGIARSVPDVVLARVYGLLESLIALTVGLGSIVTPLLIELLGLRGALVLVGALAPAVAAAAWIRLRVIDREMFVRSLEVRLLQMVPFLRPLPMASIEQLARSAGRKTLRSGEVVFNEGDRGDGFYVVCDGSVELRHDGATRHVLGHGEAFGEIALLRGLPRTLTAVARSDTTLYVVDPGAFVSAVGGYSLSARAAEEIVSRRLEPDPHQPI
jgi:MFS family permease